MAAIYKRWRRFEGGLDVRTVMRWRVAYAFLKASSVTAAWAVVIYLLVTR